MRPPRCRSSSGRYAEVTANLLFCTVDSPRSLVPKRSVITRDRRNSSQEFCLGLEGLQNSDWVYLPPLSPFSAKWRQGLCCLLQPPWTIVIPVLFLHLLSLSGKKALLAVLVPPLQSFLFQHLDGFLGFPLQSPNLSMGKGEKSVQSSAGVSVPSLARFGLVWGAST